MLPDQPSTRGQGHGPNQKEGKIRAVRLCTGLSNLSAYRIAYFMKKEDEGIISAKYLQWHPTIADVMFAIASRAIKA